MWATDATKVRPTAETRRTMQLIPKDTDLGWTPYAWLIYLMIFWFGPIFSPQASRRAR